MRSAVLALLLAVPTSAQEQEKPKYGILLLAHGGDPNWNREVTALRGKLDKDVPTEAAFGMAYGQAQVREIQNAADRLEQRGVQKLVTVPLFVSSESEVMDQIRYVLGIKDKPSKVLDERMRATGHEHRYHSDDKLGKSRFENTYADAAGDTKAQRVKVKTPLVLTPALDDHPVVSQILAERAKKLSREPARETVVLVAHGPVSDEQNQAWLAMMERVGGDVKDKGGFKAVAAGTLRDDAPTEVREKAAKELREKVRAASRDGGRVIVVPHLIARGGIERNVTRALEGTQFAWDGKTLMPHEGIQKWALERAAAGARQGDMRKYK